MLTYNVSQQIFLGIIAFKNFLKQSFHDLLEHLKEAGIFFIFFSKEDYKTTSKLGDIFLCELDFNKCISLIESTGKLEMVNIEGNVYLPSGIEEIRNFLKSSI